MSTVAAVLLSTLAGAGISSVVFYLVFFSARKNMDAGAAQSREDARRLAELETELKLSREERERLAGSEAAARARVIELEKALAAEKAAREQFEASKKLLTEQLQGLANQILLDSQKRLQETSEKGLKTVLDPLKEKLGEFKTRIEEVYSVETRERLLLKQELDRIVAANQQMSAQASDLTKALKGDSKAQGDWGEFVLENVLESSGLREGEQYVRQGGVRTEDGRVVRPDIVVRLPDGKHLVVDSKVSLPAYEEYVNRTDEAQGLAVLKQLHESVYRHVDELSQKRYDQLPEMRSPDFVLMFVPTEAMFSTVVRTDKKILNYAWERRVAIVSPTTLLASLMTVASIWKVERQNKNALEISRQAGLLYDRFVSLLKSLDDVGRALGAAQRSYDDAVQEVTDPSRGLVRKIEDLRDLGAKAKKKIDAKYLNEGDVPSTSNSQELPKLEENLK